MNSLLVRLGIRPILWLLIGCSIAGCILAWVGSVRFADVRINRLIEREMAQAELEAKLVSAHLNHRLAQARSIPLTLSQDPSIQMALARFGPNVQPSGLSMAERGEMWRTDALLQPISTRMSHMVEKFELTSLWLSNAAGDTVAEGHALDVNAFIGANYVDRAYFKAAQQGLSGRQFAIGRVTNVYGLYFSSPVQIEGRFVGMVGVGLAVPKLSAVIEQVSAVVTDDLGVIVLAKDSALLMHTMPGATVNTLSAEDRDRRYKRQNFDVVDIKPAAMDGLQSLYWWLNSERPHVLKSHPTNDGALHVYVLRDLGEPFSNSQRDQVWWFALVCLLVLLTVALVAGATQFLITTQKKRDALQNLNQMLTHDANTDALTGCANRRHFMHLLEQERNRSTRYGFEFCLLSMDIDHFKQVNDTYGHAAGDEVLKHFVATIQGNLRDVDTLGRIGGEEFSILLPQTTAAGGKMMAERIRASVEASPVTFSTTQIAVTVSIGGVEWQSAKMALLHEALARADEALYAAKHNGRNRVVWTELPANSTRT